MKKILFVAATAICFASCTNNTASTESVSSKDSTAMSKEDKEERNKEAALASVKVFDGNGNPKVDEVFKNADKDIVDHGTGEMPATKGIDSSKAFLDQWVKAFPDYKGSDFTAVADGDYVMIYGTWTGTWKNELMGMKPTGKSFKVADVDIFKFNDDGKMIEHRAVQSINEIAHQTGMKMPEAPKQ